MEHTSTGLSLAKTTQDATEGFRRYPSPMPSRPKAPGLPSLARALRRFALDLPGATEHFPWGERVAKIGGRVFVFLGLDPKPGGELSFSVKLPASGSEVLDLPVARPTGYGLGKSGWVTITIAAGDPAPPPGVLTGWIEESYRAVAPRKAVAALDGRPSRGRTSARRAARRPPRRPASLNRAR